MTEPLIRSAEFEVTGDGRNLLRGDFGGRDGARTRDLHRVMALTHSDEM